MPRVGEYVTPDIKRATELNRHFSPVLRLKEDVIQLRFRGVGFWVVVILPADHRR